jgi:hypothetical protein
MKLARETVNRHLDKIGQKTGSVRVYTSPARTENDRAFLYLHSQ